MDADVIVVGAGPTGLMLANELRTAGVRALVLERQQRLRETPRANGLGGQILQLLHFHGMLTDLHAVCTDPHPAPRFPFGGVHLDFGGRRMRRCSRSRFHSRVWNACWKNEPWGREPGSAAGTR
ncbi:FAD-dependent oxidoreductase [Streptomyces sp. NPDC091416]|uniref:FAD-dependent oxidoreductase n=1 Tax=Streptomyces sp. NPDC091416 TaxID=3366003 RepID=UPI0038021A3E